MNGRLSEIVPLVLLIAFFGIQQRGRKQLYYRFWFVGWLLVFFSYAVWELRPVSPVWFEALNALRFDLILLAALTFMVSFLRPNRQMRKVLLWGTVVGTPVVLAMNAQEFVLVPKLVLVIGVVLWQVFGQYAGLVLLPRYGNKRSWPVCVMGAVFGVMILREVLLHTPSNINDWALAEVYASTAVLYAAQRGRKGLANLIGVMGFAMWALFYLAGMYLQHHSWTQLHVLYQYWNFPKYFVAFSMILKIPEDAQEEEKRMAKQYASMYEDFRLVFDNNPHPALIYAEPSGKFLLANRAAVACYGYSEKEFLARRITDFELPDDDESVVIGEMLPVVGAGIRTRVRHRDGHRLWVNITGHSIRYQEMDARLIIVRDVTEKVEVDLEMVQRAHHDALTGLPNRRLLEDRMERALERSIRDDKKTAVFTIDIDHFKKINDTYGHPVGDECLKIVAERLSSKIRNVDTLARVGGEEFIALIGGLSSVADAERIAKTLLQLFETPMQLTELELRVTVSIGVAVFPNDGYEAGMLYQRSDEALYTAKQTGRNRYVCASTLTSESSRSTQLTLE
jgi:diguanylate cyclase (GGDEF)-like protein/PAS domain S-box-containing protein